MNDQPTVWLVSHQARRVHTVVWLVFSTPTKNISESTSHPKYWGSKKKVKTTNQMTSSNQVVLLILHYCVIPGICISDQHRFFYHLMNMDLQLACSVSIFADPRNMLSEEVPILLHAVLNHFLWRIW